jgi:hypothetical protein
LNDKKLGIWLNLLFTCVFVCYVGMWSLLCRVRIFGLLIMWVILGILRKKRNVRCYVVCELVTRIEDALASCLSQLVCTYVCMLMHEWPKVIVLVIKKMNKLYICCIGQDGLNWLLNKQICAVS